METNEAMLGDITSSILFQALKEGVLVKNMNTFTCMVCNTSMTGIIPAESHLLGTKHKKAVQISKIDAAMGKNYDGTDSSSNDLQAAIMSGEVISTQSGNEMICVTCNKSCTGKLPMIQHLASEVHAKMKRAVGLGNPSSALIFPKEEGHRQEGVGAHNLVSLPFLSHPLVGGIRARKEASIINIPSSEKVSTTSRTTTVDSSVPEGGPLVQDVQAAIRSGQVVSKILGNQIILVCVPCNKQCTGEVPMRQHLTSEVHAKKVRMEAYDSNISSLKEEPKSYNLSTSLSNVSFTEDTHNVQDVMLSKAIKEGIIKLCEHDVSHLHCVVCDVNCTGKDSMKEHLVGKNHLKMQKAKQLIPESSVESFTTRKSEIRDRNFPLDATVIISSSVIPPPPQFEDSALISGSAKRKRYEELGTIFRDDISYKNSTKSLNNKDKRRPSLNDLMRLLPDIRVYSSTDELTDLFDG